MISNRNSIFNCVASIFKFRGRVKVTQACRSPPGVPSRSVNSISTGGSDYAHHIIKVHIFREGHKILRNLHLLSYVVPVKSKVKISQNVVALSEYINFTTYCFEVAFFVPNSKHHLHYFFLFP